MAIFTALATLILGAGSAWIGVLAGGLEIAAGIAVSLIAKAVSGTPAQQSAVSGTLQGGGNIQRSFIAGYGSTAGSLVYANEWGSDGGTPNAYHTQVICLADLPVAGPKAAGLAEIYVNGVADTILWGDTETTQGFPVQGYRDANGTDHLWVKFYDGTQTVADPFLVSTFGGTGGNARAVSISIGSPAEISLAAHGLVAGQPVIFSTTGALPLGIVAGVTYYVMSAGLLTDSFQISASIGGAAVNTAGAQSGSQFVAISSRPYSSTRVGTGCAYAIMTALVNDGLFSGFPTYKFALNGTKFYDISKDSTAGGSGSHRYTDRTTWGGDGDTFPAVQIYNILRGMTFGGSWFYGLQSLPAARLPAGGWITSVNKCRATVTGVSGPEPTYRSGGEIGINVAIADAVTSLLTTCQGRLAETGGVYTLHLGAPDSPVFSITDDNIYDTETQSFTPFFGLADTVNGITASYPEPAQAWNSTVAPPLYNAAYEVLDGNRRLLSNVSLDYVPYAEQVQRLMLSALNEARRARRHTIVVGPEYWVVEPGDFGTFSSVRNGYDSKLFRVDGVSDKANLDVILDITEVDPADYDFDHDTDFKQPTTGALVVQRPQPQLIASFGVSAQTFNDGAGDPVMPGIAATWGAGQADVRAVLITARVKATAVVEWSGQIDYATFPSGGLIPHAFISDETYEVQGTYVPFSQRAVTASAWLTVTTDDVTSEIDNIERAQLAASLQSVLAFLQSSVNDLQAQMDSVAGIMQDQDAANYVDKTVITQQLGDSIASYTSQIGLVATSVAAVAAKTDTLFAAAGGNTSQVNVSWEAVAAPTGYSARYAIQAAVNDGSPRVETVFLDVPADPTQPTRFGVQGGQFALFASDGTPIVVINENGEMISGNGALYINLLTGALRLRAI